MNFLTNLPNINGITWLVQALLIVQLAITFLLAIAVRQDAFRRVERQDDVFLDAPWLWFFVVLFSGGYLERTHGRVIAKEPSNHQGVRYEYMVGSQRYTGSGRAGSGGLSGFEAVKIGDQVEITYLPVQPSESVIGLGSDALLGFSILLFGILPIFSIGGGALAAWRLRKLRAKS